MKKAQLFIVVFLVIAMLLSSCDDDKNIGEGTAVFTETPIVQTDISKYKIIRPDDGDDIEVGAAVMLKDSVFDNISQTMLIGTDWTADGKHDDTVKEILVGQTNYSQTTEVIFELTNKDYSIVISDSKIVITGGSPGATVLAVEYFLANYIDYEDGKAILKSEENYTMKYDYKYEELDISVVSLNVLTASNAQKNQQAEREPRIADFVATYQPYSLGVQECEIFWRMRLDTVLTGYARAQEVTSVTKNYIYYRTDKLKVVDSGVFWLSETPEQSSKGFGSSFYISCCWAIFESLENGSRYVHMNTHLDVNSEEIREKELTVLLPKMEEFINEGYAVVLTGDFNSLENSVIYSTVITAGVQSSRYLTINTTSMGTFNDLKDVTPYEGPIDYCFVNDEINVCKYSIIDKYSGGFMSDHNALYVEMMIYPR